LTLNLSLGCAPFKIWVKQKEMKQTLEEAARECRRTTAQSMGVYAQYHSIDECPNHGITYDEIAEAAFIKGAEWQAKQSPWISVKERLPETKDEVLVLNRMKRSDNYFVSENRYANGDWAAKSAMYYEEIAWMPIPSFDDILEANRDVLERIKEKGD
jgi:hypothetical protein